MPIAIGSGHSPAPELAALRQPGKDEASFPALKRQLVAWFLSSGGNEAECVRLLSESDRPFAEWPLSVQNEAKHEFGTALPEILSLLTESDEEIFLSSWTHFASRQENIGREDRAAQLYAILSSHPEAGLARERLAVYQGGGDFGLRVERLARNFHSQAFDPSMLGGMMVASTAFQGLRMAGLARLLSAEASWWTRGQGAKLAASALGLSGEIPAFLFSSKGLAELMGRSQDWSPAVLSHEGAALGISLLYLKSFGAMGRKVALQSGSPLTQKILPDLSAFTGLYLGHQTEAAWGLRPQVSAEIALTESLAFWLQLKVGGELSHRLMGSAWRQGVQELQWRADNSAPPLSPGGVESALVPAGAAGLRGLAEVKPPAFAQNATYMMGHESPASASLSRDVMKAVFFTNFPLPPEATPELQQSHAEIVARIVDNIHHIKGLDSIAFFDKLRNSRIEDVFNDRGQITSRIQIQDYATTYWRNVQEMDPLHRATGSLYDHLMQEGLERTYREGEQKDWDALLKVAGWNRRVKHLEVFFQERGWDQRYAFQDKPTGGALSQFRRATTAWYRERIQKKPPLRTSYAGEVEALSLSPDSKRAVTRYLDSFLHGKESREFLHSDRSDILLSSAEGKTRRERLSPELALAALEKFLQGLRPSGSRRMQVLEDAIKKAAQSGTPLLQFDRLFKILATENLSPKLTEIASGEPFHWGKLLGILKLSDGEADYQAAGNHIAGSVYTGYVFDPILAEKFARFYDKVSLLMRDPTEQTRRKIEFHGHAYRVLRRSNDYGAAEVLELLNLRKTPISRLARQQILAGDVDLKVVSRAEAQAIWDSLKNNENRGKPVSVAFYVPEGNNPEGVPLIVVQRQSPGLQDGQKVADAVYLAAIVVHEFQHYLDSKQNSYFEPMERLRSEMRSWLEEVAFMVENGIMDEWDKVGPQSPYGFGVHLRNLIDKDYIEGPRDLVVSTKK